MAAESEDIAEDVAELREDVFRIGEASSAHARRIGSAEAVIVGTALRIAEHIVGLGRFLELLLRFGIVRVVVGVILQRQFAVGALDLIFRGVFGNAKDLIIIALAHDA